MVVLRDINAKYFKGLTTKQDALDILKKLGKTGHSYSKDSEANGYANVIADVRDYITKNNAPKAVIPKAVIPSSEPSSSKPKDAEGNYKMKLAPKVVVPDEVRATTNIAELNSAIGVFDPGFQAVWSENKKFQWKKINYDLSKLDSMKEYTLITSEEKLTPVYRTALPILFKHLNTIFHPKDRVQLVLGGEYENGRKDIVIHMRAVADLTAHFIEAIIEEMWSKYNEFFPNGTVIVSHIKAPVAGNFYKHAVDIDDLLKTKKCIVQIKNDDDLCIPRAVALANADIMKLPNYKNMTKSNRNEQKNAALALCQSAKISTKGPHSLSDIMALEEFLGKNIYIIHHNAGNEIIYPDYESVEFKKKRKYERQNIYLLFAGEMHGDQMEGHVHMIRSIKAYFNVGYYCEKCHVKSHAKSIRCACKVYCDICHRDDCDADSLEEKAWHKCESCNRSFPSKKCFDNHKETRGKETQSMCQQVHKCEKCGEKLKGAKKSAHVCYHAKCQLCRKLYDTRAGIRFHECYVQKAELKPVNTDYIFYDFETYQDKNDSRKHKPNYVAAIDFDGNTVYDGFLPGNCDDFCKWILQEGQKMKAINDESRKNNKGKAPISKRTLTLIAHNAAGYDLHFIHAWMITNNHKPEVVYNGSRLITLTLSEFSLRFIDSYAFIAMPLAAFPKTFGIQEDANNYCAKGYFPHFFNQPENMDYVGTYPDTHYYGCDSMSEGKRKEFLAWHAQQISENKVFDFKTQMREYCYQDVNILRKGCLTFREGFLKINPAFDVFNYCTIASACNNIYRASCMPKDTIAILRKRMKVNKSAGELEYLAYMQKTEFPAMIYDFQCGEYICDGYDKDTNTVFEYYGDYWHGNPEVFNPEDVNQRTGKSFEMLNEERLKKEKYITKSGYKLCTIWENDWIKMKSNDAIVQEFMKTYKSEYYTPIDPKDAFFGGRTNAVKLYNDFPEKEVTFIRGQYETKGGLWSGSKIKIYNKHGSEFDAEVVNVNRDLITIKYREYASYKDVTSLYPTVNYYDPYPVGHPTIIKDPELFEKMVKENSLLGHFGFIKCSGYYSNTQLYHPVLPERVDGKLEFNLHPKTAVTYSTVEVAKAIEMGFVLTEVFEINQYEQSTDLFKEYVGMFLKIKQECSGWPDWCVTDADKQKYIDDYELNQGIRLEWAKIVKNPGMRAIAKICLNTLWGKFGEALLKSKTVLCFDSKALNSIVFNPKFEIGYINEVTSQAMEVNYKEIEAFEPDPTKTSYAIAAYTTAHARLRLYQGLELLDRQVIYFDTDSIIYSVSLEGEELLKGDYLGDWTDELEGGKITEIGAGGPKNYTYKLEAANGNVSYKTKVKGITLNYRNTQLINHKTMIELIHKTVLEGQNGVRIRTTDDSKITRNKKEKTILNVVQTKDYKFTYTKRDIQYDTATKHLIDTLPKGFAIPVTEMPEEPDMPDMPICPISPM